MDYRRKHIQPKIRSLKKKKRLIHKPWFWVALLLLLIGSAILYFIFFSPTFRVSKIEVLGNEKIKSRDIEDLVQADLGRNFFTKSIFTVDSKKLAKDIAKEFPATEDVKIQKKLPNNLLLEIKERKPFALFCQNQATCFFLDENGIIFEKLESFPQNMVVVKKELGNQEVFLGEQVIERGIVDTIDEVTRDLRDNFQIDTQEVLVSNPLVFKTSEGWKIYFDPTSEISLQMVKMNALLKDEISLTVRKSLQYIYLQYRDRAYYKTVDK